MADAGSFIAAKSQQGTVFPLAALLLLLVACLSWTVEFDLALITLWLSADVAASSHYALGWLLSICLSLMLGWLFWQRAKYLQLAEQMSQDFLSTFDQSAVGMAHVAPDGSFLRVNPRFALMLQYDSAELIGRSFHGITHPDDLVDDIQLVQKLAIGEIEQYELEKRYIRRDGSTFWASLSVSFHRGASATDCYFVSVIEDIDVKKQAVLALQASVAQVQFLLDATGDAIIGINRQSDITFVNQTALQQLGFRSAEQLLGLPIQTLISKQKCSLTIWREISRVLDIAGSTHGEAELFVDQDGAVLPSAYRAISVPQADDGTVMVISWQNIRERKLQQSRQHAQSHLLHRLLDNAELGDLLTELVHFIEQQQPNLKCSILLADLHKGTLHVAAGPSLPTEFNAKVDGLAIRYGNGSCGTAAATGQSIVVSDVRNDMLWINFQDLIAPYDWLQACWSTPFFDTNRHLLGTFAVYSAEHREPTAEERELIQFTVTLAAFLVERSNAKSRFDLLSKAIEQSPVAILIAGVDGQVEYKNQRFAVLTGQHAPAILEQPLYTVFPSAVHADIQLAIAQIFAGEQQVVRRQDQLQRPDGRWYWQESCFYPIVGRRAEISHVLLELEDITPQKLAEQQWMESELRFRTLLDNTPEISVQGYEADGTTFYWNKASEAIYGYAAEEAIGKNLVDLIIPSEMQPAVREAMHFMADSKTPITSDELQLKRKDGSLVAVYSGHAVVNLPGREPQIFCMDIDLTERKRQESGLRLAEAVFNSSQEGILITDIKKNIISVNPALERLFGYSQAELIGQTPTLLRSGRHSEDFYQQMWHDLTELHHWQGEVYNKHKDGTIIPLQLSISAVFNEKCEVSHYAAVFTDLSKIRATEAEMMFLSEHDELTDLPNRQLFMSQVDHAIKHALRENAQLAVLMLDIDHFKDVNESFGHQHGDQLLQVVAQTLKRKLRDTDVIARLGGDEFAILLNAMPQPEDAAMVANKLIALMAEPWVLGDKMEVTLGASVGISIYPDHGTTTAALLQGADAALYKAKAAGRNTFTFYSDEYTQAARQRITLEAQLRKAIKLGHLRVYYQPQVEIYSGRIIGAEALVRWLDPERGLIPPGSFIPVAESCGLIHEIGEFVLAETCRQGRQWLELGLPRLTLAVNVSPQQFKRNDMRKMVTDVLENSGFPAFALELELTESALMENEESVVNTLNELRGLGIRLAIDDFGTGYSSLAYLKRFPLDVLKIDKKFIDDIPHSKDDMAIANAIIGLAHTLGFKVMAEGVETAAQLEFLQQQRCDHYQGYLFSPPVPAEKFQAMLEQQLRH
jgi:diguanylate cyclase (GGDEF)-like protein/PAS domain S-box-containing protein